MENFNNILKYILIYMRVYENKAKSEKSFYYIFNLIHFNRNFKWRKLVNC